jgi:hypothetical protein
MIRDMIVDGKVIRRSKKLFTAFKRQPSSTNVGIPKTSLVEFGNPSQLQELPGSNGNVLQSDNKK